MNELTALQGTGRRGPHTPGRTRAGACAHELIEKWVRTADSVGGVSRDASRECMYVCMYV